MRDPLCRVLVAVKCHSHHIEHAFVAAERLSPAASEETLCRTYDPALLSPVYTFLRGSLYAFAAGLDLYKMYSSCIIRNDVNLKMPAAPVSFQDNMSHAFQHSAGDIFSCAA